MNLATGEVKAYSDLTEEEKKVFIPVSDEVAAMTAEERIEWAKKQAVSQDSFIIDASDEDTKFVDEPAIAAGPRIGIINPSENGEIDISILNRKDRRKLMKMMKLHLVQEDKKTVVTAEDRRKLRKKHGLKMS